MPKLLYIVAGSHKQAQWFARDLQLTPNQWVYLHRKDQLRGIRNFLYTTFGSAWENPVTYMGEDLRLANAIFVKHSELHQIVQALGLLVRVQQRASNFKERKMKYEYGVEYETNGEKPDLPDDVLVEYKNEYFKEEWLGPIGLNLIRFRDVTYPVTKFRIVDERYKPKEQA